jgi:hypothetical protein
LDRILVLGSIFFKQNNNTNNTKSLFIKPQIKKKRDEGRYTQ